MRKLLLVLVIAFIASSCEYEFIEPVSTVDPTDTISFSNDILPIFNNNQYCTSCHKTGGTQPDLTVLNAYQSINDQGLIDLSNPESSEIYTYPSPNTSEHSWKKYTTNEADLVLQWIKQGALDN